MKTICYKFLLVFLLFPVACMADNELKGRYTKQKKITKEYNVSANSLLKVENSYGNIDITTWDQNKVEIEVIIKTNGNDEEKVQEKLDEIDVEFQNSSSGVYAKTLFERNASSWWNNLFGGGNNVNMEINYRIKAPARNNVDLDNDYGSITIDRLLGNAKISSDYGRLLIGELLGDNNQLSFDYTRNSSIGYVKRAKINADYSEYSIEEAGTLDISADYTTSHIRKVENISFNCDYGSIEINKSRNLKGQGDYVGVKLGSVYNTVDLNMDYGSASIQKIMKGVKNVKINSDYTSIRIGHDRGNPFSFKISTSFGGVKGIEGSGFTINKRNQSDSDNYYEGYFLSREGGTVDINMSFGSITFVN